MGTRLRTHSELMQLRTFNERFEYLKLDGKIGSETFGFDRFINQQFYKSGIWLKTRDDIIVRDLGNDLGVRGYEIYGRIIIHHMNPISIEDLNNNLEVVLNKEYLITTCLNTHNAIHYGNNSPNILVDRCKGDTCPWKKHY